VIATVLRIASFDFFESVRSRKALALLALYVAGSLAASGMFTRFVMAFEDTASEVLSVGKTETAGAMTEELMLSDNMLRFFEELVGDKELAKALVRIPPLALFYGWLAFTFIPLLTTLTSGDAVAAEVASGSVRFALFRVDRLTWALGKLLGQAILMALGIAAGAVAAFLISTVLLADSHRLQTLMWLGRFSVRAFFYGFAYLGMAVGASLYAKSVNGARAAMPR
jgi:ABC-type transport system involved in multi-copper enzyme maturation permease subunit